MKIRHVALTGFFGATAIAGMAILGGAAARGATPVGSLDIQKTVTVQVADRDDSGKGVPTTWAQDTFTRKLVITTEGPAQDAELKTVPQSPSEQLCAQVAENKLVWQYKMVGVDDGTFKTVNGSATGSPGKGKSLVKDATGTFKGGFTATFDAPAFWCSYDESTTADQRKNTSSSEYPALYFGKEDVKGVEMPEWKWTYDRCAGDKYLKKSFERWVNGAKGNFGDIRGAKCEEKPVVVVPTTPVATPPVVTTSPAVAAPTLPKTGSNAGKIAGGGAGLAALGAALFFLARRHRIRTEA